MPRKQTGQKALNGFGGFGFTKPEAIEQDMQLGLQQAAQSGNVQAFRLALGVNAGNLVAPPPALQEARKKKEVIAQAMKNKPSTGDAVADQRVYLEAIQKGAIEAELPDIAIQATEQLSTIQIANEERARLKSQDARLDAQEGRAVEVHEEERAIASLENLHAKTGVLVDSSTGSSIGNFNLQDPDEVAEMKTIMEEDPNAQFTTMGNYLDMTQEDRLARIRMKEAAKRASRSGSIEMRKLSVDATATNDFALAADNFVDVLINDPGTFGIGGQAEGMLDRVGAHARSVVSAIDPNSADFNDFKIQSALDKAGINDAKRRALVMDLGYALATSREGGRLTDQDIDRAILTLGIENPNPAAVAEVFGDLLQRRTDAWNDRLTLSGLSSDEDASAAWQIPQDRLQGVNNRLTEFRSGFTDSDKDANAPATDAPNTSGAPSITVISRPKAQGEQ